MHLPLDRRPIALLPERWRHCHAAWKQEDDEARLEDGKPGPGGDMRDAGITPQRREVEQLSASPGAELEEALEGGGIPRSKMAG